MRVYSHIFQRISEIYKDHHLKDLSSSFQVSSLIRLAPPTPPLPKWGRQANNRNRPLHCKFLLQNLVFLLSFLGEFSCGLAVVQSSQQVEQTRCSRGLLLQWEGRDSHRAANGRSRQVHVIIGWVAW